MRLFEHWVSFHFFCFPNCFSFSQHSPALKLSIIVQDNKLHSEYEHNGFSSLFLFLRPLNAQAAVLEQILLSKDICNERPVTVRSGIYAILNCKQTNKQSCWLLTLGGDCASLRNQIFWELSLGNDVTHEQKIQARKANWMKREN